MSAGGLAVDTQSREFGSGDARIICSPVESKGNQMLLRERIWRAILTFVPTYGLQAALGSRPGAAARFILPGERCSLELYGACWVTINED